MIKSILLSVGFIFASLAVQADPIHGIWQTTPDDNGRYGHIEVKNCDGTICGFLRRSFEPNGIEYESQNKNKAIIWNMVSQGGGKYDSGKIWSPDRDKVYSSKLELNDDQLNVSGCIMFVCRDGGIWVRIE